ncbi:TSUP family transporter [Muricoccus radiodurans]|uniref:TSUP family transporter n=1 Tax=Muricoccus radiodurans TaxID=2231721 RepID=UPI003CF2A61D
MEDPTFLQYGLVAAVAFLAATVAGIAGYGTGLILPPILVPIIGAEAVVPVIGLAAVLLNGSRLIAFRDAFSPRIAALILIPAVPFCALGAWGYTRLSGPWVTILLGAAIVVLVPLRRALRRRSGLLRGRGVLVAGAVYGLVVGGTTVSGALLLAILLSAGLTGLAVIATDAGISVVGSVVMSAVFGVAGALPPASIIMGLVIGAAGVPGAFVARRLAGRLSLEAHARIVDAAVIAGGLLLVWQGLLRVN